MLLLKLQQDKLIENQQEELSENRDGAEFISVPRTQQDTYQDKQCKTGH